MTPSSQMMESPVKPGRFNAMLEDGELDREESEALLSVLHKMTGDSSELGELGKTSMLPVNEPMPDVVFPDSKFLFTGTCAFGTRKQCHEVTEALGGECARGVTQSVDFVVLGTYVTDSWAHENFGRKIEKAIEYRNKGIPIAIITEQHWVNEGGFG